MKKVIILLVVFLGLLTSCSNTYYTNEDLKEASEQEPSKVFFDGKIISGYKLITITCQGKQHEFIHSGFGIAHWPDCKYCKEYENNR